MSKFIYKDTLQTKYNEGTILTDDVKCKTLEVNKITSDNPFINIDKDINLNSDLLINGDLSINGDINIEDIDIDTIKTNTITSDNSKIDFNKGISTTKYLSIGNNNYNITVDGGLCLGNFAAQPYNDGLLKIGTGTGNNDRQTGLLFDNNGALNVRNKIITNDLESKNGNNIIKIYDNSILISKDNGTNWRGLISAGTGTNSVILNNLSTNTASGDDSYTEGTQNTASGNQSHAEGYNNVASGNFTHAEGYYTTAAGRYSHAEGYKTQTSSGNYTSHAEGSNTIARGESSHAEGHVDQNDSGKRTINGVDYYLGANAKGSHSEGHNTIAQGIASHAEGGETAALINYSHAEGNQTIALGSGAHAEGTSGTSALDVGAHAEGGGTIAFEDYAHSEGVYTTASGQAAHAEGYTDWSNRNNENIKTWASHKGSHAEGIETQAKNEGAHSEGYRTKATGMRAHSEGYSTTASGNQAHAEGHNTVASSQSSHAGGQGTYADQLNMTAIGQFNTLNNTNALFVVGNGADNNNRSDAFVVYDDGNILLNNTLFISGSGHSQFLTFAQQNYANNDSDTRSIQNPDFSYYIIGDIITINIPLKSGDKFVSSYRSRNDLANDFVDDYLLNIDLSDIKLSLDTYYNSTTSTFYFTLKQDIYINNNQISLSPYLLTISNNTYYSNQYFIGCVLMIKSKGPASGSKTGDYGDYYVEDFAGFSQNQCLTITFKYVKLT